MEKQILIDELQQQKKAIEETLSLINEKLLLLDKLELKATTA